MINSVLIIFVEPVSVTRNTISKNDLDEHHLYPMSLVVSKASYYISQQVTVLYDESTILYYDILTLYMHYVHTLTFIQMLCLFLLI